MFRNQIPGDESTDIVPVDVLTEFEYQTLERRVKIDRALATIQDMHKELNRQREQLQLECQHHVFEDKPGFPYNTRVCSLCGTDLGSV